MVTIFVLLLVFMALSEGFVPTSAASVSECPPAKVVVTGAGGKTGQLLFSKLLKSPLYDPVGVVRSEKKATFLKTTYGARDDQIVVGDIAAAASSAEWQAVQSSMEGAEVLCVVTSAVPVLRKFSLLKMLFRKLTFRAAGRPEFNWSVPSGTPENVDYKGQLAQFDAAVSAGVKKVVLCSSMGGTQSDNFLNSIGKQEDGTEGDILKWKREAEKYLVNLGGVNHVIVHPGGLTDKPKDSRKIVFDVNDALLERKQRMIYRGDVAEIMMMAIPGESNEVFDIISEETEGGIPGADTSGFSAFVSAGDSKKYSYE